MGSKGFKLGREDWGRKGWSWVRRGSNEGLGWSEELGSKRLELGSEEFGSRSRVGIGEVGRLGCGVGVRGWVWEVGVGRGVGSYELGSRGLGLGKLGSGELGSGETWGRKSRDQGG